MKHEEAVLFGTPCTILEASNIIIMDRVDFIEQLISQLFTVLE